MAIIDKPTDYFNTVLYTGNNSSQAITGVGFQPDFTWLKSRTGTYGAYNPQAYDSVRGAGSTKDLTPASTAVEGVDSGEFGYISAFGSDGFTLGAGSTNSHQNNGASTTYVSWNWKAGTSFTNDASATGIGSIDSTGSFNNDSGFSIVSYTGTGSAGSIKHGMNIAPKMIIVKSRSGTGEWITWHTGINIQAKLSLNTTDAIYNPGSGIYWNSTLPTSSVFSVGTSGSVSGNGTTYIAYCFADTSMSKMGSYTGNGSTDGPFIYTGFKPAWFMIKRTNANSYWTIFDNKRSSSGGSNEIDYSLDANVSNAEETGTSVNDVDFLSNGIKIREDNGDLNSSGSTIIYMAFAENPLVASNFVPTTAR